MVNPASNNGEESDQVRALELKRFELETQRFEFEKLSETQNQELQRRQISQARWDTFWRFFGSAVISGGIAAAITVYGTTAEEAATNRATIRAAQQSQDAADNRRSEILIQLLNAREAADSNLRARMFEALLANYFEDPDERSQITILEMIGLNFRDAVQVKPMFELLDIELKRKKIDRAPLRQAAKAIIADQIKEIRHARNGGVCSYEFAEGDEKTPECFPRLTVKLIEIAEEGDAIKVRVNSKDGALLDKAEIDNGDKFSVTYYDMPMTDYTIIAQGRVSSRYSIVLQTLDLKAKKAKIAIAVLPINSFSTQQEYKFDEAMDEFLNPLRGVEVSVEPN